MSFEDIDTLRAMAQEWIDKLSQFASVYALAKPRTLLFQGHLQLLSGHTNSGLKLARRSVAVAQAMSMPYDDALGKVFLAKYVTDNKLAKVSTRLRTEAADTFAHLGVEVQSDDLVEMSVNSGLALSALAA